MAGLVKLGTPLQTGSLLLVRMHLKGCEEDVIYAVAMYRVGGGGSS